MGLNEINIYAPALKPYDIRKVKDAWLNSVYYVTAYMICNFVAHACSYLSLFVKELSRIFVIFLSKRFSC
jgi:hypothetical protein